MNFACWVKRRYISTFFLIGFILNVLVGIYARANNLDPDTKDNYKAWVGGLHLIAHIFVVCFAFKDECRVSEAERLERELAKVRPVSTATPV